ncbi:hypothetical protein BZA70DRAFT_289099 [Myxozyma melibiosi]|uniref:WD40 repeat-like protein n=1 Tax=Myxozyma melibiosi TaxID=54550 RepID=A0ABR1F7U6_9ASCO
MVAPEIPGFYYDEEKGKYFKVLPGSAGGGASFYTTDKVNKRLKTEAEETRLRKVHRRTRITLSTTTTPIHSHGHSRRLRLAAEVFPMTIASLPHLTEMGNPGHTSRGHRRDLEARTFCGGLRLKSRLWGSGRTDNLGVTCMDIQWNESEVQYNLWIGTASGVYKEYSVAKCLNEPSCQLDMTTPFAEFSGPITSISRTEKFGLVTAECASGDDYNATLWTSVKEPFSIAGSRIHATCYHFMRFRSGPSPRCSAACDETTDMAIGGSEVISTYHMTQDGMVPTAKYQLASDVFALEYWQPQVFLAGLRDGGVRIFDTRVPATASERIRSLSHRHPTLLRHPSAISKMKIVKDAYFVVSGLEDSLALYDLRSTKLQDRPPSQPPSPQKQNSHNRPQDYSPTKRNQINHRKQSTTAVITYDGYENDYVFNHAFDISNDSNLLAVADQSHRVKLYNVWTGMQMKSPLTQMKFDIIPRVAKWSNAVLDKSVSRVTYSSVLGRPVSRETHDGNKPTQGLLVSNGARVDYWSWNTTDVL